MPVTRQMELQGSHDKAKKATKSMNSHQETQKYIKGISLLYLFYKRKGKNDIEHSQTSVFYFSYNVSKVACKAKTTLL